MKRACLALLLLGSLTALSCGNRSGSTKPPCPTACKTCNEDNQCQDCNPAQGAQICVDDVVSACNSDGTIGTMIKTCDYMLHYHCGGNDCLSPCDVAAAQHSYIGCDYFPTPTLNAQLDPMFDFAVVVANPLVVNEVTTPGPALIKVTNGSAPCVADGSIDDNTIQVTTVEPGSAKVIVLPWIEEVSQVRDQADRRPEYSVQQSDGAYHLCSSLPVTAYQFNPLQFEKQPAAGKLCPDNGNGPERPPCHSYTNDASTLLPTATLGKEYIVASRGTMALARHSRTFPPTKDPPPTMTPGFFTIVGTQDETTVTVDYRAFNYPGVNIAAHGPGESDTFTLGRGEVLQVLSGKPTWKPNPDLPNSAPCVRGEDDPFQAQYCDLGKDYDLTGTHILADKPIAVFGGHSCSFAPYNKWACDHLEQQMFPLNTWGQHYLAAQTFPSQMDEPNIFRVISGANNNTITFDSAMPMQQVTLNAGEWTEFVATGALDVKGSDRLLVVQYMVGENYFDRFVLDAVGDPAMGLVVPLEQYRKSYDFLTPQTYTNQFVTVIALSGTTFTLDNQVMRMPFDNEVGGSGYSYKNDLRLDPGVHHISSDQPFGIAVSGTAAFTSYLFPGGLNLNELTPQ